MDNAIKKIKRPQSLSMEAMQSIKALIFRGDYSPGEALPGEIELSGLLGVSRPVLREAIRVLQMQGFLEIRRGKQGGTFVTDLNRISFSDNLEALIRMKKLSVTDVNNVRLLIEPEVFRLAALHAGQEAMKDLARIVEQTMTTTDLSRRARLNTDFHRRVADACGNLMYAQIIHIIMDFIENFVQVIKPAAVDLHGLSAHAPLLEALAGGDGDRAADAARKHVQQVHMDMIELEIAWLDAAKEG